MVARRVAPPQKHFRRLDWKKAKFLISCPAMTDSGMNSFEVDDTWHIVHGTPGAGLVPFRCRGGPAASFAEVSFLADCISFDHDMPAVVRPHAHTRGATRVPFAPLFPTRRREDTLSYYEAVESALSSMTSVRLGARLLALRYGRSAQLVGFQSRFAYVHEALGLYAMATRQVEILGEYLCLYRVLERGDHGNGTQYSARHLAMLSTYDFGALSAWSYGGRSSRNVFEIYRKRAVGRLAVLRGRGWSDATIAKHLYDIRNGLAHGGRTALVDRTSVIAEVGQDLPLVKLLARLVVDNVP